MMTTKDNPETRRASPNRLSAGTQMQSKAPLPSLEYPQQWSTRLIRSYLLKRREWTNVMEETKGGRELAITLQGKYQHTEHATLLVGQCSEVTPYFR